MSIRIETAPEARLIRRLHELKSRELGPKYDPWDPELTWHLADRPPLTSIEVTVTNQCNLRCEHCAVGDLLTQQDVRTLPIETLRRALDAVPTLLTFSLTGGEPAAGNSTVQEWVVPLLQYAKARGLRTQVNTNLTLPLERYLQFAEWVDVLHISYNYPDPQEFARVAYAHAGYDPRRPYALLERMEQNAVHLAERGVFLSAETILTNATLPHIETIHKRVQKLGCLRHEIHPLYPSDYAASMALPSLEALANGIDTLLKHRDPELWLLFGTLPFFACSPDEAHRALIERIHNAPNTTVRNDPDGRNRLNISSLDGSVHIQDFADEGSLGSITQSSLQEIWQQWLSSKTAHDIHCHCPAARCLGPNLIVAQSYYPEVDWHARTALLHL